jgi:hypothetical protein
MRPVPYKDKCAVVFTIFFCNFELSCKRVKARTASGSCEQGRDSLTYLCTIKEIPLRPLNYAHKNFLKTSSQLIT